MAIEILNPVAVDVSSGAVFELLEDSPAVYLNALAESATPPFRLGLGEQGGSVLLSPDSRYIRYQPRPGFAGTEPFAVSGSYGVNVHVLRAATDDTLSVRADESWHTLDLTSNDEWFRRNEQGKITSIESLSDLADIQIADDGKNVLFRFRADRGPLETVEFTYGFDGIHRGRVSVTPETPLLPDTAEVFETDSPAVLFPLANDAFWNEYTGPRKITQARSLLEGSESKIEVSSDGLSIWFTSERFANEPLNRLETLEYIVDNRFVGTMDLTVNLRTRRDQATVQVNARRTPINLTSNDSYLGPASNWLELKGGRVTSVTPSTHFATIEIDSEGQGVLYTPPLDFFGQDEFEYQTENGFREQVVVTVEHLLPEVTAAARRDGQSQLIDVLGDVVVDRPTDRSYRITSVEEPVSGGTASIVNNQIRYTPPVGDVTANEIWYTVDGVARTRLIISGPSQFSPDAQFNFCNPISPSYRLDVFRKVTGLPNDARIATAEIIDRQPDDGSLAISTDGRSIELMPNLLRDLTIRMVLANGEKYKLNVKWPKLQRDLIRVGVDARTLDVLANDRGAWPCTGDDGSAFSYDGAWNITAIDVNGSSPSPLQVQDGTITYLGDQTSSDETIRFRYVVDGRLQGEAELTIDRLAKPDQVVVHAKSVQRIPVLGNDSFSIYGAAKITHVSGSQVGATIQIIEDGRSLLYQAPLDAIGPNTLDSFTYTVDDKHTATVKVTIERESPLATNASYVEMAEGMLADVASDVRYPFLQNTDRTRGGCACGTQTGGFESGPTNSLTVSFPALRDTRLSAEVQGVIYRAIGDDLVIIESEGRDQVREIARIKIGGTPEAIYQSGSRLTLLSRIQAPDASWLRDESLLETLYNETRITFIDTTNSRQPRVIQSTQVEGRFRDSQFVDGKVRLALEQVKASPKPKVIIHPNDGKSYYEALEPYQQRAQSDWATFLRDSLPQYLSYDGNGILVRSGWLHAADEVYRSTDDSSVIPYSFLTVDPASNEPGILSAVAGYGSVASSVLLGDRFAYLFSPVEHGTRIQRIDWGSDDTDPRFDATGMLRESVSGSNYLAEYEDTLLAVVRLVNGLGESIDEVVTLKENDGWLEVVGRSSLSAQVDFSAPTAGIRIHDSLLEVPTLMGSEFFDLTDSQNPLQVSLMRYAPSRAYLHWITDRYFFTISDSQFEVWDAVDKSAPVSMASTWLSRMTSGLPVVAYDGQSGLVTFTYTIDYGVTAYHDPLTNQLVSHETSSVVSAYRLTLPSAGAIAAKVEFLGDYNVIGKATETLWADQLVTFTDRSATKATASPEGFLTSSMNGLLQASSRSDAPTVADLLEQANVTPRIQSLRAEMASATSANGISSLFPLATEWRRGGIDVVIAGDKQMQHWREQNGQVTQIASDFVFATIANYDAAVQWHNDQQPLDVNGDGFISPIDALLIINRLNAQEATGLAQGVAHHQIASPRSDNDPQWDSSGDGYVSPVDAILVINELEDQTKRKRPI